MRSVCSCVVPKLAKESAVKLGLSALPRSCFGLVVSPSESLASERIGAMVAS
jgi:hypothetical protein